MDKNRQYSFLSDLKTKTIPEKMRWLEENTGKHRMGVMDRVEHLETQIQKQKENENEKTID